MKTTLSLFLQFMVLAPWLALKAFPPGPHYVIYGIVRDHGGWLDVESTPGHGATISFCIPTTDEEGKAGTS